MSWLALDSSAAAAGCLVEFLTFGFLHREHFPSRANMLLLYFAGCESEPILGRKHILAIFGGATIDRRRIHCIAMPGLSTGRRLRRRRCSRGGVMRQPCRSFEVVGHLFFVIPLKLGAKFFGMAIAVIAPRAGLRLFSR
jgi:hypothetical protein